MTPITRRVLGRVRHKLPPNYDRLFDKGYVTFGDDGRAELSVAGERLSEPGVNPCEAHESEGEYAGRNEDDGHAPHAFWHV